MTRSTFSLPTPFVAVLLALLAIAPPRQASAAEGYDNCTGFITSLPATITTQGTWCLKQDLSTAITSGNAITINTNNVTIDCNGFKLGGLLAGPGTGAAGIYSQDRVNETVRHCAIRGFFIGVDLYGSAGGGHLVEDNRFDGNTYLGVQVQGDGSVVRRNLVFSTGGSTQLFDAVGIMVVNSDDVTDNTVSGVLAGGTDGSTYGIVVGSPVADVRITGNRVRGLTPNGIGSAAGILDQAPGHSTIRGNDVVDNGSASSTGVSCANSSSQARDNIVNGFASDIVACSVDASNYIGP